MTGMSQDQEDTPLHKAVRYSDNKKTCAALKAGYDPDKIGLYQWNSLHEAANIGDVQILKLLLKFGANPNKPDSLQGCSPLHYAASEGHIKCVQELVDAGAQWDMTDWEGNNSLDIARGDCVILLAKLRDSCQASKPLSHSPRQENALSESCSPSSNLGSDADTIKSGTETGSEYTLDTDEMSVTSLDSLTGSLSVSMGSWRTTSNMSAPVGPDFSRHLSFGHIQLSFEYNSKKATFKIRVWQLTDLLLPPVEKSMISGIVVKTYLLPDKRRETKRKTEEQPMYRQSKKPNRRVDINSQSMIMRPSSFQFTRCPEYTKITGEMLRMRIVHLEVCALQKYTRHSFVLATWNMPMAEAAKRLVKQSYLLTPRISPKLPDNMKLYHGVEIRHRPRSCISGPTRSLKTESSKVPSLSSLMPKIFRNQKKGPNNEEGDLMSIMVVDNKKPKMISSIEMKVPTDDTDNDLEHALQQILITEKPENDHWTSIPMTEFGVDNGSERTTICDVHNSLEKSKKTLNKECSDDWPTSPSWLWDNYMEPLQTKTLDDEYTSELDGPYLPMVTKLDMRWMNSKTFLDATEEQTDIAPLTASSSFIVSTPKASSYRYEHTDELVTR